MRSFLLTTFLFLGVNMNLQADAIKEANMPIQKISLFSSGVGFFEHSGVLENSAKISLLFKKEAMNDVLKSLSVYDAGTTSPFVSYPSEETLEKTLEGIKINISGNPSIEQILFSLKGAEIEVLTNEKIKGKIIGTQTKAVAKNAFVADESFLSLMVGNDIKLIAMNEISSYSFTDPKIAEELKKALSFVLNSHNNNMKNLNIYLPSNQKRSTAISYVVPTPVWKATYRLDVSDKKAALQGWAIVDNAGDTDWNNVELSLVVGRPVSFSQPLYSPYYTDRPMLPLQIAGFAEAITHDSGYVEQKMFLKEEAQEMSADYAISTSRTNKNNVLAKQAAPAMAASILTDYTSANAQTAGEQFVFTLKGKITIERQQSAMVPLTQSVLAAKKVSVFHAQKLGYNQVANPSLAVELKNDSGMKLPTGPIIVYDSGFYAGDALLEFLGTGEKRLVSYGDDLLVSGIVSSSSSSYVDSTKIDKGVFVINRKNVFAKTYVFKNSDAKTKNLILEHPITNEANLSKPLKYDEKTASLYRFNLSLPSNKEIMFEVKEESPYLQRITLSSCDHPTLLSYSTGNELPNDVKNVFKKAADMISVINANNENINALKRDLEAKQNEQNRMRANIEAVGKEGEQGKAYIKRLVSLDGDIDKINAQITNANKEIAELREEYSRYLSGVSI